MPHLGSIVELTLVERAQVSQPKNESTEELALPLNCHEVAWVPRRYPPQPFVPH